LHRLATTRRSSLSASQDISLFATGVFQRGQTERDEPSESVRKRRTVLRFLYAVSTINRKMRGNDRQSFLNKQQSLRSFLSLATTGSQSFCQMSLSSLSIDKTYLHLHHHHFSFSYSNLFSSRLVPLDTNLSIVALALYLCLASIYFSVSHPADVVFLLLRSHHHHHHHRRRRRRRRRYRLAFAFAFACVSYFHFHFHFHFDFDFFSLLPCSHSLPRPQSLRRLPSIFNRLDRLDSSTSEEKDRC
jgi:hypothetical protein